MKNNVKIKSVVFAQLNEDYNPQKMNNGGGYFQPQYKIYLNKGRKVVVNDYDLGEFGGSWEVAFYQNDKYKGGYDNAFIQGDVPGYWDFELQEYITLKKEELELIQEVLTATKLTDYLLK